MMDNIDIKILKILQENNKISYHKLAKKLKIAASTAHSRVKKLEKKGIIKNFSAILNPEKLGYKTIAWIGLSVEANKLRKVAEKIASYDEVQLVSITTGNHD